METFRYMGPMMGLPSHLISSESKDFKEYLALVEGLRIEKTVEPSLSIIYLDKIKIKGVSTEDITMYPNSSLAFVKSLDIFLKEQLKSSKDTKFTFEYHKMGSHLVYNFTKKEKGKEPHYHHLEFRLRCCYGDELESKKILDRIELRLKEAKYLEGKMDRILQKFNI